MTKRRDHPAGSAFLFLVAIVSAAGPSGAQAQGRPSAEERALDLFRQSEQRYQAGQFHAAAELLREAYRLRPEAVLLFNLGRALEGEGDVAGAVDAYQRYLEGEPTARDRASIETRVATLRRQLRERAQLERERETLRHSEEAARAQAAKLAAERAAAPLPRRSTLLPWIVTGLGVATLAAGGVMAALSVQRHAAATAEPVQLTAFQEQGDAQTFATVANVLFIAGGVLAAGGTAWLFFGGSPRPSPSPAAEHPASAAVRVRAIGLGPGSVLLSGTF